MTTDKYKLMKHIYLYDTYPISSPFYKECHEYANKMEIKRFGLHRFHILGALVARHPKEFLGKNDPSGRRYISKIVPNMYRDQINYHEMIEADCIAKKKKQLNKTN